MVKKEMQQKHIRFENMEKINAVAKKHGYSVADFIRAAVNFFMGFLTGKDLAKIDKRK
jgi:hypothetical protein